MEAIVSSSVVNHSSVVSKKEQVSIELRDWELYMEHRGSEVGTRYLYRLLKHHDRIIKMWARKFHLRNTGQHGGVNKQDMDDWVSIARTAALLAYPQYQPERAELAPYIYTRVKLYMSEKEEDYSLVRCPAHVKPLRHLMVDKFDHHPEHKQKIMKRFGVTNAHDVYMKYGALGSVADTPGFVWDQGAIESTVISAFGDMHFDKLLLIEALESLDPISRQALTLRYAEDLSLEETAEAMDKTYEQTRLILRKAQKTLKEACSVQ